MTEKATVLVTGATGKLGTAVCRALIDRGVVVRPTDLRYVAGFPLRVEYGDLRDDVFVYRVMDGCSAVVHLGNHPNASVGLSAQRILAENVAMNANVFNTAADFGVRTLVFSSSVQATIRRDRLSSGPPYRIPYLPLDGSLPCDPGLNTYGQSKEFGERMLRLLAQAESQLSATAVRFPMLVTELMHRRFQSVPRIPINWVDFFECTAHLYLEDAGRLVADVVEQSHPGYHQYFPAVSIELRGYPLSEMVLEKYPSAELRTPIAELTSLIDVSAIRQELGWAPRQRISIELDRST